VGHPELVAERIGRYASLVGRESVIAGVDFGFGTFAGRLQVDRKIVWMKLRSLVEGAQLAPASSGPEPGGHFSATT
jgi:5-methyltetrahydropteroyltriglutamate--homocysteine methyltransferase